MERVYVSWTDIGIMVKVLAEKVRNSGKEYDTILTFKRGGLIIAAALAYELNIKKIVTSDQCCIISKKTLVVDDISDTGETLLPFKDCDICTFYVKVGTKVMPKHFCKSVLRSVWVVFPYEKLDSEEKRDRDTKE